MAGEATTLDQLYAAVFELRQALNNPDDRDERNQWRVSIQAQMAALTSQVSDLAHSVDRVTSKEYRRDACPFRDEIVSAANNKKNIEINRQSIHQLELTMARAGFMSGAAGGSAVTVVGMVAFAVGRAAGWW